MKTTSVIGLDVALANWRALSKKQHEIAEHALLSEACTRDFEAGDRARDLLRAAAEPRGCDGFMQGSGDTYVQRRPCVLPSMHGGPCRFDAAAEPEAKAVCRMCDPVPCVCNDMAAPDGPRCHCGKPSVYQSGACTACGHIKSEGCARCRP